MTAPPARLQRGPWLRAGLVLLLALLAVGASTDLTMPGVRAVALLLFLVLAPGLALVGWLGVPDPWREAALVIGVSLAVDLLVATALAYGSRSAGTTLGVLVGIAVAGAVGQCVRGLVRSRRGSLAR